jgi:hypothetical protein
MSKDLSAWEENASRKRKEAARQAGEVGEDQPTTEQSPLSLLQQQVGNRAIQRMLAQRSGGKDGAFDLDDETAARINRERGGGQPLDGSIQAKMSQATGDDFSDVKVHNSSEAADLSQQVGAAAFTTGKDIFFNQGNYNPQTGSGQELLAHELTHVVQQSSGAAGGGGGMTVNAPGDQYEQEADSVAKAVTSAPSGAAAENQAGLQRKDEDDEIQMKALNPEEEDDEELAKK